ncbi:MAG: tetratricopeptide repeat protein [Planctomycetes bacterium]|nr:tetratricopeptide repeat protein [Planctomycetota bacterium]
MSSRIQLLCALLYFGLAPVLIAGEPGKDAHHKQDLARKAVEILKANCYRCHGQDGANEGGFNFVTDLRQLVSRRRVIPGEPAKSKIIKRLTNPNDPMPPEEEKVRPSTNDIALLKKWIEAGAPATEAPPRRPFLSQADMLQAMADDLDRASPRERPFLRYFTLTHLHNAGLSADELQSFRHGLSKLINSLSWGKRIAVPKAVDEPGTILRIDLRDFQWNEKTWDAILARNPYGVIPDTDVAKGVADATRCKLPHVRADWFVAVASRPPLYHDILQLPRSDEELEKLLRVEALENIRQERAARAGFNSSGVSRNNRLIERHESGATVYWKSYDFGGNTGKQNLFARPLGPGDDDASFVQDGGEIIFSLPNGLQAYFLVDAKGQRIDKGPTAIVSDPRRPDRAVENGLSCISCHSRGIIEKADQIRAHVLKSPKAFSQTALDTILALYPPPERLTAVMRADAKRFQDAVAQTGAPLSATEPIAALAARFETELDLPLVAAEAGVAPAALLKALERFPHLAKELGPLRVEGGTVQRQVFVDAFPDLVDALKQGSYLASSNVAADKLIRLGNSLLPKDPAAALRVFSQALEIDPDSPMAHGGKGDAYRHQSENGLAIAAYTEALRLDPRAPLFFNNRGLVLQRQGEHDKALADYGAALRLDPRFAVAYHNRGVTHYGKGELDRAIADYTEALRLDDQSALAFNNRGYAFFDKEQFDRAIEDFDQALRLDPEFAAAFSNRGLAHMRKNRLERAVADFTAAIKLNPNFASAFFNRSVAFTRLGNQARADADRQRAVKLDPSLGKD